MVSVTFVSKCSKHVTQIYGIMWLFRILEVQQELQATLCVCREGRRDLNLAKRQFTTASLGILANYRKRQLVQGLLHSLNTIKTLVSAYCLSVFTQVNVRIVYGSRLLTCLPYHFQVSIFNHFLLCQVSPPVIFSTGFFSFCSCSSSWSSLKFPIFVSTFCNSFLYFRSLSCIFVYKAVRNPVPPTCCAQSSWAHSPT